VTGTLFHTVTEGDCLDLASHVPKPQLVYVDPPYNTGKRFTEEWLDSWPSTSAFIDWLMPRLEACWEAMTANGNMIVHIDWRTSHYIKVAMDQLVGEAKFRNEIIWAYRSGGACKRQLSRKHDTLLWYAKGDDYTFNVQREPYAPGTDTTKPGFHPDGRMLTDVWPLSFLSTSSNERTGYPTQKPLTLLTRIITMFSNEGDIVLDGFSGSGTTGVAAKLLNRSCTLLDVSPAAIEMSRSRLNATSPMQKENCPTSDEIGQLDFRLTDDYNLSAIPQQVQLELPSDRSAQ